MRRRAITLPALVVVALAALSCGRSATEVRFLDLVTDQRLTVGGQRLRPAEIVAVDETWLAVTIQPGDEIRTEIDLLGDPTIRFAGCLECAEPLDGEMDGALEGAVRSAFGREIGLQIGFDAAEGWWNREIDLSGISDTRAELAIRASIPAGCVLRLREATVRHLQTIPELEGAARTQVLLISVDTLRADGGEVSGEPGGMPSLDRLAAEAERWTTVYAAASWTKPSHASLLTGYYPETHRAILLDQGMDAAVPTLAERFKSAGFATAALVFDCTWLSPRWGFGKGFDSYRVTQFRAGRQAREAADWVLDHRDRDFFFFLHTFEPHSDFAVLPYEAPGLNRRVISREFGIQGFGCRRGLCAARFVNALSNHEVPERPKDAVILRDTYSRGVTYLDASLGELFDTLRQSGVWDDLTVVVTSDHGEEFGEHGGFGHHSLYGEILRVPLLIKWPGGEFAGVVNSSPGSGVDIAPTLLGHAGLPSEGLPGAHLHSPSREGPILAGTLEHAVVSGGFKGIFGGRQPPRLFNLIEDPGELVDLADRRPDVLANLESMLEAQRRQALALYRSFGSEGVDERVELSERERERLKAFGYLQ